MSLLQNQKLNIIEFVDWFIGRIFFLSIFGENMQWKICKCEFSAKSKFIYYVLPKRTWSIKNVNFLK